MVKVVNSLQEMESFIRDADLGLSMEVEEGDYDSLIGVMEFLQSVKDKQAAYDEMFEPLHEIIEVSIRYLNVRKFIVVSLIRQFIYFFMSTFICIYIVLRLKFCGGNRSNILSTSTKLKPATNVRFWKLSWS